MFLTLDAHDAADDHNVTFFPPLHVRQDFLQQPHQAEEVGVHDGPHLVDGLTLDGSDQTPPSVTDCERKSDIGEMCLYSSCRTKTHRSDSALNEWCELTEDVHPALRQAVHAGFDGVLVTYVQLLDLQSPAQSPACCLHQRLALTQVPHGGVHCNRHSSSQAVVLFTYAEL